MSVPRMTQILESQAVDISTSQADISIVKADIALIQDDTALMKADMALMKADVALMKADVALILSEWGSAGNDYEAITLNGVALGLTAGKIAPVGTTQTRVIIGINNGNIRYRKDGVDPTASVGMILKDGDYRVFTSSEAELLKMINISDAVDVLVEYAYK